ncbi:hypothetical protein CCHR01_10583 [Colletotrichum chrysophilum]|uniref:Uncharacterized protein n=1 Tax=Colletotrichum chrysophilum TaxID=1836956 RepID=A0AAD9AER9_9PEZI|nr:hypothetical protein CCHR01_10583 [Colletotrichum chrysophilum]
MPPPHSSVTSANRWGNMVRHDSRQDTLANIRYDDGTGWASSRLLSATPRGTSSNSGHCPVANDKRSKTWISIRKQAHVGAHSGSKHHVNSLLVVGNQRPASPGCFYDYYEAATLS